METLFPSLNQACATLAAWRMDYDIGRPNSRLGWCKPSEFARTFHHKLDQKFATRKAQRQLLLPSPSKQAKLKPGGSHSLDKTWRHVSAAQSSEKNYQVFVDQSTWTREAI